MTAPPSPTERQANLATLLADRDVLSWYKDHRSTHTAEVQLQQLELFCRRTGADPSGLVALGRAQRGADGGRDRRLQELVQSWVDGQREAGRPDSYIATNWASVRSWLKFNEASPQWAPKLRVRRGSTLGNETVPTQQDLARILAVLSPRDRVIALLMAHSGIRPGVLGNRYETAGLRLRDLPDLDTGRLEFGKVPFLVVVPAVLSKSGSEYVTFGSAEAASVIADYLLQRRRRGERLEPDSAVVRSEPKTSLPHRREFLSEKSIGTQLRKGMAKVCPEGKRWRAYVLRSFFSSQMESAERAGKTTRTFREALMGHMTGVEFAYHLGKKLHPERLEEMRAAYHRVEPYLLTTAPARDDASRFASLYRTMLRLAGYSDAALQQMDLEAMTPERIGELVDRAPGRGVAAPPAPAHSRQQIVAEADVPALLELGWLVKSQFNSHSYVLERAA